MRIELLNYYPTHEAALRTAVWTLIVAVIVVGPNYPNFLEAWFLKAILVVALLHFICLASFWYLLTFSTLGVAMLMGVVEGISLGIMYVVISSGFRKQGNG